MQAARGALDGEWGRMTGFDRARLMCRLAELIEQNAEELARAEVSDSGKLYREMVGQTRYLPQWYYYFAGLADKVEGRSIPSDKPNFMVYTRREPVGVVGAITPWNSPLLLLTFKLAPALAAGCTEPAGKPSEHATASTLALAGLVHEAGFPAGTFNVVVGSSRELGAAPGRPPGVDKVAITGSTATGRAVAKAAAENINRVTLELGGKSPQIVFDDADLAAAANGLVAGVFAATGQTCMAGSRLIVHEGVHHGWSTFSSSGRQRDQTRRPHRPRDRDGSGGQPAAGPEGAGLFGYGERRGCRLRHRRCARRGPGGLFVRPTVITGVDPDQDGGPRGDLRSGAGRAHRLAPRKKRCELANDTPSDWPARYGPRTSTGPTGSRPSSVPVPSGSMPTECIAPNVPFGGLGDSGLGRENGIDAINEYTENKSVLGRTDRRDPGPVPARLNHEDTTTNDHTRIRPTAPRPDRRDRTRWQNAH